MDLHDFEISKKTVWIFVNPSWLKHLLTQQKNNTIYILIFCTFYVGMKLTSPVWVFLKVCISSM